MADENAKVSHDDLDAALEEDATQDIPADEAKPEAEEETETQEETPEEPEETPVDDDLPDEPTDNSERSMLGRKVKGLSDELAEIKQLLRDRPTQQDRQETIDDFDEDDDLPITKKEAIRIAREEQKKVMEEEKNQRTVYNETAERVLIDLGLEEQLDEKTHIDVYQRASKNWKVHTGNAKTDALINFKEALTQTLKAQLKLGKEPKNPLNKNKDKTPKNLGGGDETKTTVKSPLSVELDEYSKEFVKKTGMKEESVREALTGDAPTYLAGKI